MFPINHILQNTTADDLSRPFFCADWDAPARVKTLLTTRNGGVSQAPFHSLNLGAHVGDNPEDVAQNRSIVQKETGLPVCYLQQTHSTIVVNAVDALGKNQEADACVDRTGQVACGVMTADCLPVLFADKAGTVVAAAHAGWRGLANGVLAATIQHMNVPPDQLLAYLGPAISADAFEVGGDVRAAFCAQDSEAYACFQPINERQYLADIYALARLQLNKLGINQITGGNECTVLERERFFSYRRDGQTGRMLSAIWLAPH